MGAKPRSRKPGELQKPDAPMDCEAGRRGRTVEFGGEAR
jgi:hypothetical protein